MFSKTFTAPRHGSSIKKMSTSFDTWPPVLEDPALLLSLLMAESDETVFDTTVFFLSGLGSSSWNQFN
jgi:hypothetical protein